MIVLGLAYLAINAQTEPGASEMSSCVFSRKCVVGMGGEGEEEREKARDEERC